jgi:hypothetical protein
MSQEEVCCRSTVRSAVTALRAVLRLPAVAILGFGDDSGLMGCEETASSKACSDAE